MPVTIVCDGCGKELRPMLWRHHTDAAISAVGSEVTFGCAPNGTIIVACSDACRRSIDLRQGRSSA